ncbi:P-loop containing nucleoside triphosphate hydrolase protein [Pleomassaria siparia CBS 279.74]|uniref:Structural maintenance of chromosomes protein 5 n=1 Tax=Pleomassaria siparia CBS 279.74 TaxID=1314801 RepID=A0A6G1K6D5_9PLEO|nr:P-loop containing nucleoside triphosphate hydrolase protein [Pleomassaria siparia CBS 279.74]
MPGLRIDGVARKRHRSHVESSNDNEDSGSGSDDSSSSKRMRVTGDASFEVGDYDDTVPSQDVHQPGAIVRVKLTNFVTYTAAEFHPGPSLNMVIGPNGTGKSTLVCAICLGLGWGTRELGRAKDVGEFVKHGCEKAEIEIELAAGKNHRKNPVVRRVIRKEGNKSIFFINGNPATQKAVTDLARSFSIQIDNLCQFLPQDRVVEFARLDPVSLLRETQRAAAPEQMIIWHDNLKKLRVTEKELEVQQTNHEKHLADLKKKQTATQEDVDRWNQRQGLLSMAKTLERCRPIIERVVLLKQLDDTKTELRASKREQRQLELEEQPARQAQEEMVAYRDEIDQIARTRTGHIEKAKRSADRIADDIKADQAKVASFQTDIESEMNSKRGGKQSIAKMEAEITRLEDLRQNKPVRLDDTSSARITELRSEISGIDRRQLEVNETMKTARRQVHEKTHEIKEKKAARDRLDTQSGKQASLLAKLSRDAAAGWAWIEANLDKLPLKGKVYGPPILGCTVTNLRMADAVESQLRPLDYTAITCETGEDAKLITDKLYGEMRLHQVSIRTAPQPISFYQSPVTRDELAGYGMEGWLLDYIRGPDPVLAMLCDNCSIHRTAVSSIQVSDQQHRALEDSPITNFIIGQDKHQISRRREYNVSSTRVTAIRKAQYFVDQPVNVEEIRRLDNAVKELEQGIKEEVGVYNSSKEVVHTLETDLKEKKEEMKRIQEDQEKKRKAINAWRALPGKIAEKQTEKESLVQTLATSTDRIRQIMEKIDKTTLEIARKTLEYTKAVVLLRQLLESLVEAEIRLAEANSEVEALEIDNQDIIRRVAAIRDRVRELDARKKAIVDKHNAVVKRTNADLGGNDLSEEEVQVVQRYTENPSLDDLEDEIETTNARLSMMADGNPNAIREFHKREEGIEALEEKLDDIREGLNTAKGQITEIRGQWEPELDALVAKISDGFSNNFQGIGCAGQVGVYKDDDFENWSIQIQVRFRENESLAFLDSHRQSGGERAVSTIFYLMALQDLARSPFRVVDEINQGMDPRNERMVHERMVDIACRERTSQYFLITPKLLSNLKFHPKMKVHCIASGEHMPDQYKKLDFQQLADLAVRIRRQQAVAV